MTRKLLLATTTVACFVLMGCNRDQTVDNTSTPDTMPSQSAPGPYDSATNAPVGTDDTSAGLPPSMGSGDMADNSASADTATGMTPGTIPTVDEATLEPANTAQGFVHRLGMSDQFEIQAGQLALSRPVSDEVKTFAQDMIDAHTATSAQLKDLAANASLTLPTGLTAKEQGWLKDLQSASDATFGAAFMNSQVQAHQAVLTLLKDYAANGDNAELKQFAANTAPKVQDHLTRAEALSQAAAETNPS